MKKLLVGVGILVGVWAVAVSRQPDVFTVTRAATLAASAPKLFALVNDFRQWERWSPWAKLDPNAKNTFSGPAAGVGSGFAWDGNKDVGAGQMHITESKPNERIQLQLDFTKPFKSSNTTVFTFKSEGKQTAVTWTMSGKNNLIGKTMGLFMDCDKRVGGQFEEGLRNLQTAAAGK